MTPRRDNQPESWQTWLTVVQWLLLALFAFRVGAQLWQKYRPVDFLPAFEAWQSGFLPYGLLFFGQMLLIVVMVMITVRLTTGRIRPNLRIGEVLLSLGAVYFAFMLFRFGAALTFAQRHSFLGAVLPAFFHLVLGGWLLGVGLYHGRLASLSTPEKPRVSMAWWLAYPVVMAVCLWLHVWLVDQGVEVLWATYTPVAVGAAAITLLERLLPHRDEWQPNGEEVKNDLIFMVLVQMLLPKGLTFLVAVMVLNWLEAHGLFLPGLWPHDWPPAGQATLMILLADFLRYWLHRASHEWSQGLWRLHAVHHSPQKLNWVNVGRFHPIEKSLQFLCDAAPFILLGVSAEVLALYFVFYAVNGFFQHCNVELRLGLLNCVISGPELHRWHHSWEPRESNKNYGNNIIVWDLLFGTYFLPKERVVDLLGLRNRQYPMNFLRQMRTPFVKEADQAGE